MITRAGLSVVLTICAALVACATVNQNETGGSSSDPIGLATMLENGSIVLDLRAEGPGGLIGHSRKIYKPGDIDYEKVKAHVGGISIGEEKLVPPWSDADSG